MALLNRNFFNAEVDTPLMTYQEDQEFGLLLETLFLQFGIT